MDSNSFKQCQTIEKRAMADVLPFLRTRAKSVVLTDEFPNGRYLQSKIGDLFMEWESGRVAAAELKSEENDGHGNFFLETWSNLGMRDGWMYTLKTDILLYYFINQKNLYSMKFDELYYWAFCVPSKNSKRRGQLGRIHDYPEKPQSKHDQLNKTMGACVPIADLSAEIKIHKFVGSDSGFSEVENGCQESLVRPQSAGDDNTASVCLPTVYPWRSDGRLVEFRFLGGRIQTLEDYTPGAREWRYQGEEQWRHIPGTPQPKLAKSER